MRGHVRLDITRATALALLAVLRERTVPAHEGEATFVDLVAELLERALDDGKPGP